MKGSPETKLDAVAVAEAPLVDHPVGPAEERALADRMASVACAVIANLGAASLEERTDGSVWISPGTEALVRVSTPRPESWRLDQAARKALRLLEAREFECRCRGAIMPPGQTPESWVSCEHEAVWRSLKLLREALSA